MLIPVRMRPPYVLSLTAYLCVLPIACLVSYTSPPHHYFCVFVYHVIVQELHFTLRKGKYMENSPAKYHSLFVCFVRPIVRLPAYRSVTAV